MAKATNKPAKSEKAESAMPQPITSVRLQALDGDYLKEFAFEQAQTLLREYPQLYKLNDENLTYTAKDGIKRK